MKRKEPEPVSEPELIVLDDVPNQKRAKRDADDEKIPGVQEYNFEPAAFVNVKLKIHTGYVFGCHAVVLHAVPFFQKVFESGVGTVARDNLGCALVDCNEPFSEQAWSIVLTAFHAASRIGKLTPVVPATAELYLECLRLCGFLDVNGIIVPRVCPNKHQWKPVDYVYTLPELAYELAALERTNNDEIVQAFFTADRAKSWEPYQFLEYATMFQLFGPRAEFDWESLPAPPNPVSEIPQDVMVNIPAWCWTIKYEYLEKVCTVAKYWCLFWSNAVSNFPPAELAEVVKTRTIAIKTYGKFMIHDYVSRQVGVSVDVWPECKSDRAIIWTKKAQEQMRSVLYRELCPLYKA